MRKLCTHCYSRGKKTNLNLQEKTFVHEIQYKLLTKEKHDKYKSDRTVHIWETFTPLYCNELDLESLFPILIKTRE